MYDYGTWSGPGRSDIGRSKAALRRRQVMSALLVCLAIPLLVALATGSSAAWWAVLAMLPLVLAYVAVLFRARRLLAEREMNAAFFGATGRSDGSLEELFGPMVGRFPGGAEDLGTDSGYDFDEEPVRAVGGDW